MLGVPMNCLRKMETDPLCSRSLPQYALSLSLSLSHTHTHTRGFAHSGRARNSTWGTVKYTKMKRPLRYVMDGF